MAAVEKINSIVRKFSAPLWKHRAVLLCLAMLESWLLTLIYSLTSRQYALIACQFFLRTVLPQLSKVLSHLFAPPYLYILLNLVIAAIAVTSGILNLESHADPQMDSRLKQDVQSKHPIVLLKLSSAGFDIEKSERPLNSSRRKQGYPACGLESSEPIPSNPSKVMSEEDGLEDQSHRLPPSAIVIQENVLYSWQEENAGAASRQIVAEGPRAKADAHVHLVRVDEGILGSSGVQPLHIGEDEGHSELSTEEFNAIAEAFIVKIRNQLKLEAGTWQAAQRLW